MRDISIKHRRIKLVAFDLDGTIASSPFFVGKTKPKELEIVFHHPDGDIYEIAKCIIKAEDLEERS